MAQKKEMDIPAADTLSCFQAAKGTPTSPAHQLSSGMGRSGEFQMGEAPERVEGAVSSLVTVKVLAVEESAAQMMLPANRCSGCQRKVGLTGFRCRCGELFCGKHRYSDRHDCSFDYKAAGRMAISRDNPLVRASKIVRI